MGSILLAVGAAVAYMVAYHTYGKFLARKIFDLDPNRKTPAVELNDGMDYVPTKKGILFGHHYTSIAGTGPIVGPAIGIIWGWVPAFIWVTVGCIFMGAVHDLGALAVSMRHQGRGIGDIAGDLISARVRIMFLCIIALALTIVLAIFCLVIAWLFDKYPGAVFPVWIQIPIAMALGHMIYKSKLPALPLSLVALVVLGVAVYIGAEFWQIKLEANIEIGSLVIVPKVFWSILLLGYVFIASVLPVTWLLQPRDYINGHVLFVIMSLLAAGVLVSQPEIVAPALNLNPKGAPPILPFLFVTIACGAISGFHSLVASGTTSKQIANENDARAIGYGSMLMEGMLAVFVLVAVAGGIGLLADKGGLVGADRWAHHYASWAAAEGLGAKVGAFVSGSANMLDAIGVPVAFGMTIMGVFVACFAGTTLDTATRLQRYVISELGGGIGVKPLKNKYIATSVAVIAAGALALWNGKGTGGLLLWPLFGATNQLLAALAFLVITVYLAKKGRPIYYTLIPFGVMLVMTAWAIIYKLGDFYRDYTVDNKNLHLLIITGIIVLLEIWMIIESAATIIKSRKQRANG
ncbi:MAG: carbon starvation protein A [Phycisphaerales bacterium]|jgi:carbon starvation protein|nr:carbon starvation protein A [Phycisphaerales bacterium]